MRAALEGSGDGLVAQLQHEEEEERRDAERKAKEALVA